MRPVLKIREFISQYQQKLKLDSSSHPAGLVCETELSRQTPDNFDAATLNHLLQINGYYSAKARRWNKILPRPTFLRG